MSQRFKTLMLAIPTIGLILFYALFFIFPEWFPK
jgi:hypothetical protein